VEVKGAWRDVAPLDGALLINCGDYLSLAMTAGRYVSPRHRVLGPRPGDGERTSFVFFSYPGYEAEVPAVEARAGQRYSLLMEQDPEKAGGAFPSLIHLPSAP
jgi:isopenicillin N synthase-like dioxygenase